MYKIDRRGGGGGGVQKSYTRNIPGSKFIKMDLTEKPKHDEKWSNTAYD